MSNLSVRKAAARAHSQADRIDEAIQIYGSILQEYPDDFDAYLFIGDCYLASNDPYNAIQVYKQALGLKPEDGEVQMRIELAENEIDPMDSNSPIMQPTQPAALERLIERLSHNALQISANEIKEAEKLIQQLATSQQPGDEVIDVLDKIDSLLPALLELNIRQARSSGRYDVVNELKSLINSSKPREAVQPVSKSADVIDGPSRQARRIFMMTPDTENPFMQLAKQALEQQGYFVHSANAAKRLQAHLHSSDAVIVHRPDLGKDYSRAMALAAGMGLPTVLCLDEDYVSFSYPDKNEFVARQLADHIVVPSQSMADSLDESGYQNVTCLLPTWDHEDPKWGKTRAKEPEITLGWFNSTGRNKDIASIRRVVIRIMREFPEIKLLIAGDADAYAYFDVLADERKVFLPSKDTEGFAKQLAQVDILLLPHHYEENASVFSDKNVLYAGIYSLPWVGTPLAAYQNWNAAGLLADTQDDWHTYLRQLIMDADLRLSLGAEGRARAESRDISFHGPEWQKLIEGIFGVY